MLVMQFGAAAGHAEHVVAFFPPSAFAVEHVASFIAEGLAGGERVIVLATTEHWNALAGRLQDDGVAYCRASSEDRLVFIEAEETLDTLLDHGPIQIGRFTAMLEPLLQCGVPTRMYGELVSLLAERDDVDAAVAIERVVHGLAHRQKARVLCGYHISEARPLSREDIGRIEAVHDPTGVSSTPTPAHGTASQSASEQGRFHAVRFYENRDSLARIVGRFLGEGFVVGLPAIVIATPEHSAAIRSVLAERFFDVQRLEAAGNLIVVDAATLLSEFMVDGMPDPARFKSAVIPLIERACREQRGCVVRAYGEMVDVLWKAGQTVAAVRLETLWNQLAQTHSFALLCGYSMGNFYKGTAQQDIRALHSHLVSDAGDSTSVR